jgi:hypothetical protein
MAPPGPQSIYRGPLRLPGPPLPMAPPGPRWPPGPPLPVMPPPSKSSTLIADFAGPLPGFLAPPMLSSRITEPSVAAPCPTRGDMFGFDTAKSEGSATTDESPTVWLNSTDDVQCTRGEDEPFELAGSTLRATTRDVPASNAPLLSFCFGAGLLSCRRLYITSSAPRPAALRMVRNSKGMKSAPALTSIRR